MPAESLDPQVRPFLDRFEALDVLPLHQHGAEGVRELLDRLRPDVEGPTVGEITDRTIPGYNGGSDVPVRVYRPEGDGPFPTLVYLHGGAFVFGGLESHDMVCRHLTRVIPAVVVSVDYRLAPEHPFPAAVEDAFAVSVWAAANRSALDGDGHVVVAGDSAGGNLAAAVTLLARDRDGPSIDYQVLVYPGVSLDEDWASREEFGTGYFLEGEDIDWAHDCYIDSFAHEANPYAFPLVACDHADLPPATIVTAGFDPLRDEGIAYAEALEASGVPVTHREYDDVIHGFFTILLDEPWEVERASEAVQDVTADIRSAIG